LDSNKLALPLSEHLRPSCLMDLTLSTWQIDRFEKMIESGTISNMIFYGPPGTGKTSAARIISKEVDADVFSVDGASERGGKIILHDVPDFVRTVSLYDKRKLVIIDEGEFMTKKDQVSLRTTIEESYEICRFLITTNDLRRIDKAIQSRTASINFAVAMTNAKEVADRLIVRFASKLDDLKVTYDLGELRHIVMSYFPDFRQTLNQIEFRFG
jgi:replication-associated recombination protein RarA